MDNGNGNQPPQVNPMQPQLLAQVVVHPHNGMVQLVIDPNHPDQESVEVLILELAVQAQKQRLQRKREQQVDDGGVDLLIPGKGTIRIGGNDG